MVLAFERLDNCTRRLPAQDNVCTLKICASEKNSFISLSARHFRSSSARRTKWNNNAIIIKTATNYLNWIKRQQLFFACSPSSSQCAPSLGSNTRGLFIIVYGHSTSENCATSDPCIYTKAGRRRKKKLNKHHVQRWWLYMWSFNRGKLQTEPFSRNEFLNKRRVRPVGKQLLGVIACADDAELRKVFTADGVILMSQGLLGVDRFCLQEFNFFCEEKVFVNGFSKKNLMFRCSRV